MLDQKSFDALLEDGCEDPLIMIGSHERVDFLYQNIEWLHTYPNVEKIILQTWILAEPGQCSLPEWDYIFGFFDVSVLRAAGDPLDIKDSFHIYRGCPDASLYSLYSSPSWTTSPRVAEYYALSPRRYFNPDGSIAFISPRTPTIYETEISSDSILFYSNSRNEQEVVLKSDSLPNLGDFRMMQLAE